MQPSLDRSLTGELLFRKAAFPLQLGMQGLETLKLPATPDGCGQFVHKSFTEREEWVGANTGTKRAETLFDFKTGNIDLGH
jgi:hypothetical protein